MKQVVKCRLTCVTSGEGVLAGGGQCLLARGSEVSTLTHKAQPLEDKLPEVECQVACTSMNRGRDRRNKTKSQKNTSALLFAALCLELGQFQRDAFLQLHSQ